MNEPALGAGSEPFPTERYEQLRSAALGVVTAVANGRGLALLMRHGMAAWMHAWASCVAPRPPPPEQREQAPLPAAHSEMVTVLLEMALAAAREGASA